MTPREQVIVVLFGILFSGIGLLWALDVLSEKLETYWTRERQWRAIDVRCSRERHPSYRAPLFDQDNPY